MNYRKIPVTIQAVQWNGDVNPVRELAGSKFHPLCVPREDITAQIYDELHDTWINVKDGQWIIRGTHGELYPCEDSVFQEVYEKVE